ncbi:MAG: hypothetical protein AB7O97_12290 [Planctomycetota bacterium]
MDPSPDPIARPTGGAAPAASNDSSSDPSNDPTRQRSRYRPRQRSALERIPISVRIVAPVLVLAAAWGGYRAWRSGQTLVTFVPVAEAAAVPPLELTFYPEFVTFAQPSPPPQLFALRLEGRAEVRIGPELVPDTALVRYRGDGVGAGYARVVRGRATEPLQLHPPGTLRGRVGTPRGFYGFGLRALGLEPIAGARVFGLGGGQNGVPLCEATTDADGWFELAGFSQGLPALGVRVLAPGFALAFANQPLGGDSPVVPLVATQPITGRVEFTTEAPDVDRTVLRVLAKGLPGLDAVLQDSGAFALDHVPPNLQPRLLLHGLPPTWTHRLVHAAPGDRSVVIAVEPAARVRGVVVDDLTQQPLPGAMVWHENGPAGWVQTEADGQGRFELGLVPAGAIEVRAQHTRTDAVGDKITTSGVLRLQVGSGEDRDGVAVRLN